MSVVLGLCVLDSLICLILGAIFRVVYHLLYMSIAFGILGVLIFIGLIIALMSENYIAKHVGESFDGLSIAARFEKNLNILRNPEYFHKSDIRIAARVMIYILLLVIIGIATLIIIVLIILSNEI